MSYPYGPDRQHDGSDQEQNPYAQPPAQGHPQQQPYGGAYGGPSYGGPSYGGSSYGGGYGARGDYAPADKRPGIVIAGSVMTILGAVAGLVFGLLLLVVGASEEAIRESMLDAGVSPSELQLAIDIAVGLGAFFVGWNILVIVLGALVLRGSKAVAITLVVMGVIAILGSLALVAGSPVFLLVPLWIGAALVMLFFAAPARRWYNARSADRRAY